MSTWDAARLASRRQLPKPRKMMGPVGGLCAEGDEFELSERDSKRHRFGWADNGEKMHLSCDVCGLHVCSCDPDEPPAHPWWNNE